MRETRIVAVTIAASLVAACADYAKPAVTLYEAGDYQGAANAAQAGLAAHPNDDALWGMRVRSALALGDARGAASAYGSYTARRGDDDHALLHGLAVATIEQALHSNSAQLRVSAIETIEQERLMPFVQAVADAMADSDDRVAAAAAVALLHDSFKAPDVLEAMLHSERAEARRIAVTGLARKAGAIAAAPIEQTAGDPDPRVRVAAIDGLGLIKDADAIPLLAKALGDRDETVRAAAAGALAKIGKGDLRGFAQHALNDDSVAVRAAGADLLGAAGDTNALAELAKDADPVVALEAVVVLHRAGGAGPAVPVEQQPGVLAETRALASPRWETRAGGLNLLAQAVGDKKELLALAQPLAKDPEVRVRLAAARALASAGDRDTAAAVFRAALSGNYAAQAAADLAALDGDATALATLATLAADPARTATQRMEAVDAHRTAHRITAGLVAALADANALVRIEAASVLVALAK